MIYPVHHIPGRLRIKSPLIQGNPSAGAALRGRLLAIAGVAAVEVSSRCGSAVIDYCRDRVTGLGILQQLDGVPHGRGQEVWLVPPEGMPALAAGAPAGEGMGATARAVLERTATALAAGLI